MCVTCRPSIGLRVAGRRMDADVSMDTDAILVFCVYVQFCVCAIPGYSKYPVSAILGKCKYCAILQYVSRIAAPVSRGAPRSLCVSPDVPVSTHRLCKQCVPAGYASKASCHPKQAVHMPEAHSNMRLKTSRQ